MVFGRSNWQYFLLVVSLLVGTAANADTLSLESCIQQAVANNKKLAAKSSAVEAARNERKSIRGNFLPVLRTEVNAFKWNDDNIYSFDMSGFESIMPPSTSIPPMEVTIRDDITVSSALMVIQPLTGLYQIASGYRAMEQMEQAASQNAVKTRREIEQEVTKSFFAHLVAKRMLETASAALEQVEAYEKMTENYLEAQMVEKNAILKVKAQKAEIQKGIFQAKKGVHLTRLMLNMHMGRDLSSPLDVSYDNPEKSTDIKDDTKELQKLALANRPELRAANHQLKAARFSKQAQVGAMLPELNAVVRYENSQGMGDFTPENQVFGGLMLSWNIFEWGASYYKVKAAQAKAAQALNMIQYAQEGIKLEVEKKRLDLEESMKQFEVAKAQLEFTQESLRIEQDRYEVQESEITDLLTAQTLNLKAQNDVTIAQMQIEVALRELQLATGQDLLNTNNS